ncbi:DNA repair exonuclease [Pluteus cervinus]|uniref:DNA repair exonuclease n=1 Tax=Pluteus cervinus TaxID=181527 RepID=A0ACD3BCG3_9AGAR|nr:DNA repair exonuclease [Pluteus cervinus]
MSQQDSDRERSLPPPPGIHNPLADDTIKILLATDNHIGYLERDPIRGNDSIESFREILQLAVKNDVDFVLLAGDLFHENKPSRDCLYRTIALLREYTMGDKPVQVELLSDPNEGRAAGFSFPAVNYEDPNFNVGIPVFSIHGNHDDPQGAGSEGALCALDVLSVSGLLNYMGKFDLPTSDADAATTGIAVRPVLLGKGNTRLGMYGIGNVKDQRMHFELRSNRVRMYMPKDKDQWFNILLLHQNRVKHGPQEFVPEGMFDDSIDLVIWGHEHDCRIQPEPVAGKNYYISQPGSSVATSLADGEAIEKHVALLEIQGKEFQLTPLPLRTVRPFVIESIVLSEVAEEEGVDISDQAKISKYLKAKVNKLIQQAEDQWQERNAKAVEDGDEELPPMLPLVRLKVETTGITEMFNPVRFGQEFHGRIANPRDVLVLHRAKRAATRSAKVHIDQPELSIDNPDMTTSEKLAKVQMGSLVKEYLQAQELQLLPENGMSDAIQMFVEKDDIHAIDSHVTSSLNELISGVQAEEEFNEDELDEIVAKAKDDHEKEYAEMVKQGKAAKASKKKGKEKATAGAESDDSMLMDVDGGGGGSDYEIDDDEPAPPPKKRATTTRTTTKATTTKKAPAKAPAKKATTTTGRGRGKKAAIPVDSDSGEAFEEVPDDDEEEDEEEVPKPVKRTNRAAILSQPAPKKAPAKRKTPAPPAKQSQLTFTPATTSRPSRAAASKAKGRMVVRHKLCHRGCIERNRFP